MVKDGSDRSRESFRGIHMLDNILLTRCMDLESIGLQIVIFMRQLGMKVEDKVLERILSVMEKLSLAIGNMEFLMFRARRTALIPYFLLIQIQSVDNLSRCIFWKMNWTNGTSINLDIRFILLQNKQGKTRLAKCYIPLEEFERHKVEYEDLLEALNQLEEGLKDNIKKLNSFDKFKQANLLGQLDWSSMFGHLCTKILYSGGTVLPTSKKMISRA